MERGAIGTRLLLLLLLPLLVVAVVPRCGLRFSPAPPARCWCVASKGAALAQRWLVGVGAWAGTPALCIGEAVGVGVGVGVGVDEEGHGEEKEVLRSRLLMRSLTDLGCLGEAAPTAVVGPAPGLGSSSGTATPLRSSRR